MTLYITNNGIYHKCTKWTEYYAQYLLLNDNYFCDQKSCPVFFPTILALPFKIKLSYKNHYIIGDQAYIVSKSLSSNYKIIEL